MKNLLILITVAVMASGCGVLREVTKEIVEADELLQERIDEKEAKREAKKKAAVAIEVERAVRAERRAQGAKRGTTTSAMKKECGLFGFFCATTVEVESTSKD